MKAISYVWLSFTAVFIALSIISFGQARKKIPKFELSQRPFAATTNVKISGVDIDQPLKDFAEDMNEYVDSYNSSSRRQNLIAAWGYVGAALVSAISALIAQGWIKG